jgi:hypothetical protein
MSWALGEVHEEIKKVDELIRHHVIFSSLKEDMAEVRRKAIEFTYVQILGEPTYAPLVFRAVQHFL